MFLTHPILWWTAQQVLITSLLALAVWLICQWRRLNPAARHGMWLIVLIKLITPPLVTWPWSVPNWFASPIQNAPNQNIAAVVQAPAKSPDIQERRRAPMMLDQRTQQILTWKDYEIPAARRPVFSGSTPSAEFPIIIHPSAITKSQFNPSASLPPPIQIPSWLIPLLGLLWLLGGISFLIIQAFRVAAIALKFRNSLPADPAFCKLVEKLAHRMCVKYIQPRLVRGIGSPLVLALFRPRFLWPVNLAAGWSRESVDGLVVHELAHLARRDHWVGWVELLAGCVWWWNPIYWLTRHQLRENAELACDAWVVAALPQGRRVYAEALLAVCESMSTFVSCSKEPIAALGVGTGSRRFLERRLTMIIRGRVPFRVSRVGLMILILFALVSAPVWSQVAANNRAVTSDISNRDADTSRALFRDNLADQPGDVPNNNAARLANRTRFYQWKYAPQRNTPTVPADAKHVLEQLEKQNLLARQKFEAENAQRQKVAIDKLRVIADLYAASNRLDDVTAVRQIIADMQANLPALDNQAAARPDPGSLFEYRNRVGQSFVFEITGSTNGTVWGTDLYTDDSSLATAAVHAGLVLPGQRANVKVVIFPGALAYTGSARNGIASNPYQQWEGSFRFQPLPGGKAKVADQNPNIIRLQPGDSLMKFRGQNDQTFLIEVVGSTNGTIWGDEVYTDDSPLSVAAVHADLLDEGERGILAVTICPGRDSYEGSEHNGVVSRPYAAFQGSYQIRPVTALDFAANAEPAPDLQSLRNTPGAVLYIAQTGSAAGQVWGTDTYTDDSSLAGAAVHARALRDGEYGIVKVTIAPAQDTYAASTRNGVTSQKHGPSGGSFRIAPVRNDFIPPMLYRYDAPQQGENAPKQKVPGEQFIP